MQKHHVPNTVLGNMFFGNVEDVDINNSLFRFNLDSSYVFRAIERHLEFEILKHLES